MKIFFFFNFVLYIIQFRTNLYFLFMFSKINFFFIISKTVFKKEKILLLLLRFLKFLEPKMFFYVYLAFVFYLLNKIFEKL